MTSTTFIKGTGLKKWKPAKRSGCRMPAANAVMGQRRGVAGQHRGGGQQILQCGKHAAFDRRVFDDGLDDEVAASQRLQVAGVTDACGQRVQHVVADAFLVALALPLLLQLVLRRWQRRCIGVVDGDEAARLGGDLGNAAPHGAGTDDAYGFEMCCHPAIISRAHRAPKGTIRRG